MDRLFWKLFYIWVVQVTFILQKQTNISLKDSKDLDTAERNLLSNILEKRQNASK